MNLSYKLWHLMNERDLTRAELSKQTGLPYTTIDSILKRKDFDKVKLSTLHSLKKYFGVSLDYLICDEIEDEVYGTKSCTVLDSTVEKVSACKFSSEAVEIAAAYDKADIKSKNIARQALDLPPLEPPVVEAAAIDKKKAV